MTALCWVLVADVDGVESWWSPGGWNPYRSAAREFDTQREAEQFVTYLESDREIAFRKSTRWKAFHAGRRARAEGSDA